MTTADSGDENMIRIMIVEDRKTVADALAYKLKQYGIFDIVNHSTTARQALSFIPYVFPDVIFIHTDLPQPGGLALAHDLLRQSYDTRIIFVSDSPLLACQAFELNALDFLLRPWTDERFEKTVHRMMRCKQGLTIGHDNRLRIQCLGGYQVFWPGRPPLHWRSAKTGELFALLLQNRGVTLNKDQLIEYLWPDLNPDKALHLLHNGIYYLRKAFETYGIGRDLIAIDQLYRLDVGSVAVDFFDYLEQNRDRLHRLNRDQLAQVESQYRGTYLTGCDWKWAEAMREEIDRTYTFILDRLADLYEQARIWDKLEAILLKAYRFNPYEEQISYRLIQTYQRLNKRHAAIQHYQAFEQMLREDLALMPSDELRSLNKHLVEGS
jgi:two-component SAPR family response regulator